MIVLTLSYPVSANRYWATRVIKSKATGKYQAMTYVTPEAKAYREEVRLRAQAAGVREPLSGRLEVRYELYPHRPLDYQARMRKYGADWDDTVRCIDNDNVTKVLYDALQGTVMGNDVWIWEHSGRRMEPDDKGARVVVFIRPLPRREVQAGLPLETAA